MNHRMAADAPQESAMEYLKLIHITANVDGSGRIIFEPGRVRYEHRNWSRPTEVTFEGESWSNLNRNPSSWRDLGKRLDLTRAWIADRHGRDVIALERTGEGFDLYLCDSPNGSAYYDVTIAVPYRN